VNIYVGNLSSEVTEGDLQNAFEVFGTVTSAKIITENGKELKGQMLKVNEARPRSDGRGGGGRQGGGRRY